mmetsp:Transcript_42083/g.108317  ORF Transcript_42083/g.108317 Transcript_42083/m.108317 type:complete len:103 (+) Transcript_42083:824-1132(+)
MCTEEIVYASVQGRRSGARETGERSKQEQALRLCTSFLRSTFLPQTSIFLATLVRPFARSPLPSILPSSGVRQSESTCRTARCEQQPVSLKKMQAATARVNV